MKNIEANRLIDYSEESIIGEVQRVFARFQKERIMLKQDFNNYSKGGLTKGVVFGTWKKINQQKL